MMNLSNQALLNLLSFSALTFNLMARLGMLAQDTALISGYVGFTFFSVLQDWVERQKRDGLDNQGIVSLMASLCDLYELTNDLYSSRAQQLRHYIEHFLDRYLPKGKEQLLQVQDLLRENDALFRAMQKGLEQGLLEGPGPARSDRQNGSA